MNNSNFDRLNEIHEYAKDEIVNERLFTIAHMLCDFIFELTHMARKWYYQDVQAKYIIEALLSDKPNYRQLKRSAQAWLDKDGE